MPSYSEFLNDLTNELISIKGNSVNSIINGEYFIFYIGTVQISQFKLSLYDQLLKFNTYSYVYNYFKNYILGFIGGGGGNGSGGGGGNGSGNPVQPTYKIQNKIIIG